jgi:hypothetical protein
MLHRKPLRIAALLLIILLAGPAAAFAQEEQPAAPAAPPSAYSLGQQTFAISLGMFFPLFFMDFNGAGIPETNLSLGGLGSLQWGIHLDNHWLVGAEVAGIFSKSLQEGIFYMLAITAKGEFIIRAFPFEFPVFLGAGMDIIKYGAQGHIDFMLKPGFSSLWKYNVNWGFGLNVVYWWVLQPWPEHPEMGRMGNFLEVSLTAQYSF